jgi:hypothetical protein
MTEKFSLVDTDGSITNRLESIISGFDPSCVEAHTRAISIVQSVLESYKGEESPEGITNSIRDACDDDEHYKFVMFIFEQMFYFHKYITESSRHLGANGALELMVSNLEEATSK